MALIRKFNKGSRERVSIHDEIEADYFAFERDGRFVMQIDTHGRATRDIPGKLSQTFQLDREGAVALINILKREFQLD
jgi:hypothetical protein